MDFFSLLVTLIFVLLICSVLWWLVGFIGPPAPLAKVAQVLIVVFGLLYMLAVLSGRAPLVPMLLPK
jgi:hypothetical protein